LRTAEAKGEEGRAIQEKKTNVPIHYGKTKNIPTPAREGNTLNWVEGDQ